MIRNLSFHVTSGSMLRSYANCWVIPQSTCYSFAVFFISSLHLMPCLQLGKDPALLKKKKISMYVSPTPSVPLISCVWIGGRAEMSSIWNMMVSWSLSKALNHRSCLSDTSYQSRPQWQLPVQSLSLTLPCAQSQTAAVHRG